MTVAFARQIRAFRRGIAGYAFSNPVYQATLRGPAPTGLVAVPPDPWPGDAGRGAEIASGVWRYQGARLQAEPVLWAPVGMGSGWTAWLHGFDWLRDLRSLGGDRGRRTARSLVDDWLARHLVWSEPAWSPDVLGRRIFAWLSQHDFFLASASDDFRARVLAGLARQARHLARVVPAGEELSGEARIAALKGLAAAGTCLPGHDGRLDSALKHLEREAVWQILPDGAHATRNPDTLARCLRHLVDLRALLVAGQHPVPDFLQQAIDRAAPGVRFFRHGDGELALFNGAGAGERLDLDTLLQRADSGGRPARSLTHAGYERVRAGRSLLIIDTGTAPDPGLDSAAHAAPLAFEFSHGRDRLIVNCGAGLAGTPLSRALRGTAAHSTLTLAGTNAAEIRPDGGIGRCAEPPEIRRQTHEGATLIDAAHDGYQRGFGARHRRRLYLGKKGEDVRGEESLIAPAGLDFELRFHLHPDVAVSLTDGGAALIRQRSGQGWRLRARGGRLAIEESLYAAEPLTRRARQLVLRGRTGETGALIKWALTREKR